MKRVLAVLILTLAACGQTDPPDNTQLEAELSDPTNYFTVTRPDGTTMTCNQYGSESSNTQDSKSWFGYSCDWSGQYGENTE
jgi:predicted small lipoprotein YifL